MVHEAPVLACSWSRDGAKVASAGADKTIRLLDLPSGGQSMVIPNAHEAPIKCLRWTNNGLLVSAGWDRQVCYWDLRSPGPVAKLALPERAYAMDLVNDLLIVGCAERHCTIVNLSSPTTIFKDVVSPLKWQTRTLACYPNASGFAIGSIEGRVGLVWLRDEDKALNFNYKCHRDGNQAYAVNSIAFNPVYGTFATAGSDGTIHIWDKDSKQRVESSSNLGQSISASAFSRTGLLYAYALSYDWSKGHEGYQANTKNSLMIHSCSEAEVKARSTGTTSYRGSTRR